MRMVSCVRQFVATTRFVSWSTSVSIARLWPRALPWAGFCYSIRQSQDRSPGTHITLSPMARLFRALCSCAKGAGAGDRRGGARSAHAESLRLEAIAKSVRKTSRVIVAHEDMISWGYGAEIAARIADELFEHLDAPVRRVGAMDTFVAYQPVLEDAILPQPETILKAIADLQTY